MLTHNQRVLAKIQTTFAVDKARRGHLLKPQNRVMDALREAIDGKSRELQAMIIAGKLDTDGYRLAKEQHACWTEAWYSNR
jgi:hypothetical protein